MHRVFQDHLEDRDTYEIIVPPTPTKDPMMNDVRSQLRNFLLKHKDSLPEEDQTFVTRSIKQSKDPCSHFYIMAKVHKHPWTTRPIVSFSGSMLHGLG